MGSQRSLAFQQRSSYGDCIAFLGVFQNSRGLSVQLNSPYSELSAAQRGSCPAQTAAIKTKDTQTALRAQGRQTGVSRPMSPCRAESWWQSGPCQTASVSCTAQGSHTALPQLLQCSQDFCTRRLQEMAGIIWRTVLCVL